MAKPTIPSTVWLDKEARELVWDFCVNELGIASTKVFNEVVRRAILFTLKRKKSEFREFLKEAE